MGAVRALAEGQGPRKSHLLDVDLGYGANRPGLEAFGSHFGSLTLSFHTYKMGTIIISRSIRVITNGSISLFLVAE